MIKYPKTPRLSKLMGEMLDWQPYLAVVEEKLDGANAAVSFDDGKLVLQSRGHVLRGGPRERLFERFKPWAYTRLDELRSVLGDRYVMFGEWMYAKNRIFYDALPDHFIEFDMWDKHNEVFLTTQARQALLVDTGIVSAPVLWSGPFRKADAFSSFVGPSRYKTGRWKDAYRAAMAGGLAEHYADSETDDSLMMEGVYIKIEDVGQELKQAACVVGRMKVLRADYEKVRTDDRKWGRRPLFLNHLRGTGRL